ncbi:hypothetical protein NWF34_11065 [Gordonia sp. GONU]|uniref:hypothetical protein n=1 Tax=Gordonia sp. GONU TaxID=2972949 RepID=UPI0021ABAAEF|nr:hypothetical protein [Gordonia sp. GONU]MCR8897487.1 hypothetical protein [Gordonia sp. GONU]
MSLDLEDRILDHLLYGAISVSQVDNMRRTAPFARDVFDRFIFCATQYSIYEGTWDTFAGGGIRYLAALQNEPRDLDPQRVPPGVAATASFTP